MAMIAGSSQDNTGMAGAIKTAVVTAFGSDKIQLESAQFQLYDAIAKAIVEYIQSNAGVVSTVNNSSVTIYPVPTPGSASGMVG